MFHLTCLSFSAYVNMSHYQNDVRRDMGEYKWWMDFMSVDGRM